MQLYAEQPPGASSFSHRATSSHASSHSNARANKPAGFHSKKGFLKILNEFINDFVEIKEFYLLEEMTNSSAELPDREAFLIPAEVYRRDSLLHIGASKIQYCTYCMQRARILKMEQTVLDVFPSAQDSKTH